MTNDHRPWLKNYPPGVPAEIGPLRYPTIPAMLAASVERFRDQPSFENFGVQMSYGELDRLSRDFAAYLQGVLGLRKGDRVAIMMPNILQYPVALFGILRAGLIVVSVNPLYTARELEHQLKDSGAAAIVIFEGAAATLQSILRATPVKHVIVASVGVITESPRTMAPMTARFGHSISPTVCLLIRAFEPTTNSMTWASSLPNRATDTAPPCRI